MKFNRRKDEFKPSRGAALAHKLFMAVTYPLIKPLIFIPVLIILYLAPTFMGVKPTEVHLWYWSKIKNISSDVSTKVADTTKNLMPEAAKNILPPEKGIDQLVETPIVTPQEVRRKMFEKATSAPQAVNIMERKDSDVAPIVIEETQPEKISESIAPVVASSELEKAEEVPVSRKLPLIYLDTPKEVQGTVSVHNANEIEINGTYLFLYGIYADPDSAEGIRAKAFLENLVKNQQVRCSILAYTYQDVATAMCYVGSKSINHLLVEEQLAKNVAL